MSKYDPLLHHLNQAGDQISLTFSEIEGILGFPLPASARRHAAWWSNSAGTHVQSAAWQGAGYKTEEVEIENETVRFVPDKPGLSEMKQGAIKSDQRPEHHAKKVDHHPAYGALKGMITLLPDVDLTAPAYADWKKLYDEDQ